MLCFVWISIKPKKPDDPLKCCPNQGDDCSNNGTHFNSFAVQSYLQRESCDLWDILCDGEYFKADFQETPHQGPRFFITMWCKTWVVTNWKTSQGPWYLYYSALLDCCNRSYFNRIGFEKLTENMIFFFYKFYLSFHWILKRYCNDNRFIMWAGWKSDYIPRWSSRCQKG